MGSAQLEPHAAAADGEPELERPRLGRDGRASRGRARTAGRRAVARGRAGRGLHERECSGGAPPPAKFWPVPGVTGTRLPAVIDGYASRFGSASELAQSFGRWEERPGQRRMAEAVDEALRYGRHLFVEAGTGTGKTLAYLLPALLSGRKVVVSTATRALEEQLVRKDLPALLPLLAREGVVARVALMKGLSNYLCRRRLHELEASGEGFDDALVRLQVFRDTSASGDLAEVAGLAEDHPQKLRVASSADTRVGPTCRFHESCFVTAMRREAEEATLVVVNHHLYFADLALRTGRAAGRASVLPAHDAVVFDEAHHVEGIATDFFGVRISSGRLEGLVRDARRALAAGRLPEADARAFDAGLARIERGAQAFFASLDVGRGEARRVFGPSEWTPRRRAALGELALALEAVELRVQERVGQGDLADAREGLSVLERRCEEARDSLGALERSVERAGGEAGDGDDPDRRTVAWVESRERTVSAGASPVRVGAVLRERLFERVPSVVCTSATLTVPDGEGRPSFGFVRARLGAPEDAEELVLGSPFDVARRALLYVPRDLGAPGDPGFELAAARRVRELVHAAGGGAFVLTTSTRAMRALHALLREHLGGEGAPPLLVQGELPKHALLERFRALGDAVLVATLGFWEGVDVPGRALRLVVLDKIPFAVPTDPLVRARSAHIEAEGGNPFVEYHVPLASITLKQGFGRLLRSAGDHGVVALLDGRAVTKGYGRRLLAALGPVPRTSDLGDVERFFARFEGAAPPDDAGRPEE